MNELYKKPFAYFHPGYFELLAKLCSRAALNMYFCSLICTFCSLNMYFYSIRITRTLITLNPQISLMFVTSWPPRMVTWRGMWWLTGCICLAILIFPSVTRCYSGQSCQILPELTMTEADQPKIAALLPSTAICIFLRAVNLNKHGRHLVLPVRPVERWGWEVPGPRIALGPALLRVLRRGGESRRGGGGGVQVLEMKTK